MGPFDAWLGSASITTLGVILVVSLALAAVAGAWLRRRLEHGREPKSDGHEGYVVSAVLGLLALLIGFTFAQAVQRFDTRRALVMDEANTIGTVYLRADLLPEPHRARLRHVLVRYTENRLALAKAPRSKVPALLVTNDALVDQIWEEAVAAYPTYEHAPFAATFLNSVNHLIDVDASRKQARRAKVPAEIILVLYAYVVLTAVVMGYVLTGLRGRLSGAVLLVLLTLVLMLIFDIDRPTMGGVREGQAPMETLLADLHRNVRLSGAATAPPP